MILSNKTNARFAAFTPLIIAALLAGCGRTDRATPEEHIASAQERLKEKNPKAAEIELKAALQKNAKSVQARLLLAETYLVMKRGQAAEVELSHAEQFGATPSATQLPRARAYILQGQFSRVLKEVPTKGAGETPYSIELTEARGDAQSALGLVKEAEISYDAVLKGDPKYLDALYGKARIAAGRNDMQGAMGFVDAALAQAPGSVIGLLLKGDILLAQQDTEGAIKSYTAAVDAAPDDDAARVAVASALITARRFDNAQEQLAKVLKKSPSNSDARYFEAMLQYRQGNYKDAFDSIQKVTAALPDYLPAIVLTAAIQYSLGSYIQADANAQRYVKAAPNSVYGRKLLAAIYLKESLPAKALETVEPLLAVPTLKDGEIFALAGSALAQLKQNTRAIEYLSKAAALDPKDSSIATAYGESSLVTGHVDRAISTLESVVGLDSRNLDADTYLVISYIGRKDYQKAIDLATSLTKSDPKNAALQNLLGGAYLANKDVNLARASFEKATSLNPAMSPPAINLAQMDLAANKPDEARKRLTDVLKLDAKNIEVLFELSDMEFGQGHPEAASQWLEKAVTQNPEAIVPKLRLMRYYLTANDPQRALAIGRVADEKNIATSELLSLMAQSQAESGDRDAAVATYGRVAGMEPNAPRVQLEIARIEASEGRMAAAQAALSKALSIAPGFIEAQLALADLDNQTGRYADAAKIAAELEKKPETRAGARVINGDIATAKKDYVAASKAYGEAFSMNRTAVIALKYHQALLLSGKKNEADDMIKAWLAQNKDDQFVRLYLASDAKSTGDTSRAEALYKQVLEVNPKNAVALNELALIASDKGDHAALDYAEKAYAQQPGNPLIGDTLGWVLVGDGKLERGQQLLEKAVRTAPGSNEIRYHLAVAYAKGGNKSDAKTNLQKIIASPDNSSQREAAKKLLTSLDR